MFQLKESSGNPNAVSNQIQIHLYVSVKVGIDAASGWILEFKYIYMFQLKWALTPLLAGFLNSNTSICFS